MNQNFVNLNRDYNNKFALELEVNSVNTFSDYCYF